MEEQAAEVIIVGSGPSGLATAACLKVHSIPYVILEREDCFASLWKKYSYDRLHLHLAKQFCDLPHMPFPPSYPSFISKNLFVKYLDDYVSHFNIIPLYRRSVELANYDEASRKWIVKVMNYGSTSGKVEEYYSGKFLVVASGEASNPFTPDIDGLSTFTGKVIHSTQFKNGKSYSDQNVLVVGSGNSGMEIALDLANHGANTSIVVRSPLHVLTKEMVYLALVLLKYIAVGIVDSLMPTESIRGNEVLFVNGQSHSFDSIIFCTGFKRSTDMWLKGDDYLLGEDGIPKPSFPDHWKGKNGLYCVGLSRRGLYGINADARNIADDIKFSLL
ncbi:Flavin-containing monooxygenase [Melia azedarach]|uniref:Flavin-containing monooxygenase n=1 Tax=Melia azedarach TaxID=155640 RepID=A0ACC1Y0E4_MELAZ|nr:Flavin-containing monooxygenase [Melia azedarach]